MILSRRIRDLDRKARAIIFDLLPMMDDPVVCQDPEFIALLDKALELAESRIAKKELEAKPRETITNHGKTVANP